MPSSRRQFLSACGTASFASSLVDMLPAAPSPAQRLSRFDSQIHRVLASMTLDEKLGQMAQPDQQYLKTPEDIRNYHLGSLLSGGDSDPKAGNSLSAWTDLCDGYHKIALESRLRIPLLYGIDAVHGHNNVIGATIFPHNIALGCTRSAGLVERAARITAEEVRATGANWAFAPCVAVPQDIRWGRTYEGFGESPDLVRELGAAAVRGLQREALDHPAAVLACSKHFAGDGMVPRACWIRVTPGSMRKRCAASICPDMSAQSTWESVQSCRPTTAGMASNAPAAKGCSRAFSRRSLASKVF
jgi:beta-glucosidase